MKQNNVKQEYRLRYGMPEQKGGTGMETEQTMEQRLGVELETLRHCILFRNMTDEEIRSALAAVNARRASYARRAVIGQDGDPLEEVALILSGNLHLTHADAAGNSNLMDVLGPGDTLGVLNAVGGYRLHSTITAATAAEVLFFRVDKLLRANRLTDPGQIRFVQNLTLAVAQKAQRLTKKLEDSIRRTTRERLQDYLSAQYHKAGSRTFVIPLNRQDLADFLFVDRSAMSNELCKMRDEGLLKFEKSRFELLVQMPITDDEPDPNEE
ncbi:Crp/Fnr family transcriptional regulator [Allofournierella massiliensis]|uniref:Crp/Fnr family transcriptional regulator n=1 Tax=Allofournierella massiliensis TaxID=1650663 RepID=A0ABT7UPU3_9FIRM|nr:Crp/Fnr family transcriptional regulator [Fournierella massiliensis]MDM8200909.1 Crp/Fnr family transcriptional regulator [Fournierella massiliensis]